ncbi:MAG: hypothetical protein RL111_1240 [Pseudomonadota bacterium]|jgi:pimeloyl-ACP methyl ester carboxylesterase
MPNDHHGEVRTLVLLPGLMCDHSVWEPVMHLLPPHVQARVADYGPCDSLTTMAERTLAAHEGALDIAGHSMGARVALEMMRLAPGRIGRVALLGSGYAPLAAGEQGQAERSKRQGFVDLARSQGVRAMAQEWVKGMVPASRLSDATLISAILDMCSRKSVAHFEGQIQALLNRPDAAPVLKGWQRKVWVLCGEWDAWANVAQHQAMAALLPQAHLQVLEGVGHMFPMENPDQLAAEFRQWLQEPLN